MSDQNFVETVPGTTGSVCLNVIRLEDATLEDLMGIVLEIFDGRLLPEGTGTVPVVSFSLAQHPSYTK